MRIIVRIGYEIFGDNSQTKSRKIQRDGAFQIRMDQIGEAAKEDLVHMQSSLALSSPGGEIV